MEKSAKRRVTESDGKTRFTFLLIKKKTLEQKEISLNTGFMNLDMYTPIS